MGGGKGTLFIDGWYKQAIFELTMKNFRLFETEAEKNEAVIEECSVSYVIESDKVYTTPENGGQGGVDYSTMYTTFEALEDGTFSFTKKGTGDEIQYSKDNGVTWMPLASDETVSVVTGDKVLWKSTITPNFGFGNFSSSNKFNVYGNIMSLLYGDDFKKQTSLEGKYQALHSLFYSNNGLIDASNLILPATTLSLECYQGMFNGCTNLTTAPELPATTVHQSCYKSMFYGCRSLTTAPELPATTLAHECYMYMFKNCTSLTAAPELPATTLANRCYEQMFIDCTSLKHITMLATDISAYHCLHYWVENVSSTGTFVKHPDMKSLPTGYDGKFGIPNGWTVEDAVL